jgi:hypothetical protein
MRSISGEIQKQISELAGVVDDKGKRSPGDDRLSARLLRCLGGAGSACGKCNNRPAPWDDCGQNAGAPDRHLRQQEVALGTGPAG